MEVNNMISLIGLWALAGWCGTVPWRWRRRRIPSPPDPEPWRFSITAWIISRVIGVVSGVIGGWGFTQVFGPHPEPWTSALPAAASAIGAFVLAGVITDIYEQFQGDAKNVPNG